MMASVPPSTGTSRPVVNSDSSEDRNSTAFATSIAVPMRPRGNRTVAYRCDGAPVAEQIVARLAGPHYNGLFALHTSGHGHPFGRVGRDQVRKTKPRDLDQDRHAFP